MISYIKKDLSINNIFCTIICFCLYVGNCYAQNSNTIEYKGDILDFSHHHLASLFKGKNKRFVAGSLNNREIHEYVRREKEVWYLELEFYISKKVKDDEDIWIQLRTDINATEIYVNRHLTLTNGTIGGSIQTEIGGKNLVRKRIPKEHIRYGTNKISINFTNFKSQHSGIFKDLSLGSFTEFQEHAKIMSTAPFLFAGIFIFAVLINIALYFSLNRKNVFIALAVLFFSGFLMMIYETLYWNGILPASSVIHNFSETNRFEYFIYFLLSLVIILEYGFKKQYIFVLAMLFFILVVVTNNTAISTSLVLSLSPLIISIMAIIHKHKNAVLISVSLFVLSLFIFLDDYDILEGYSFANSNSIVTSFIYKLDSLGLTFFALTMVFTSSKGILYKTNKLNHTKLKLEQLEYQFLQKHIQPHFLMNSLMSLQQLVVKNPENASKMIEALSEEFHLLTLMSKKKLVPIQQEIEMCQIHLQIMSIQQKSTYKMTVNGIVGTELIPPAIIHTLVENGITHGYSGNQDAFFELRKAETSTHIQYRLFNNGNVIENNKKPIYSGTGLKYIEARLEENYPKQWKLTSHQVKNGWEAIIEIKKK